METCNNGCNRRSIIKKQFVERITAGTKIEAIVGLGERQGGYGGGKKGEEVLSK